MTTLPVDRAFDLARVAADHFGEAAVLVAGTRVWKATELADRVDRCIARLAEVGLVPPARVGISCWNAPEVVVLLLAAMKAGVTPVMFSPRWPDVSRQIAFKTAGCDSVVVDELPAAQHARNGSVEVLEELLEPAGPDRGPEVACRLPDEPAIALFTSGSAGQPRSVVLSGRNLWASAAGANDVLEFQGGDRWLLSLPLWHVGGIGIVFRCLLSGGTIVFPESPGDPAGAIQSGRVSHVSLVPTQLRRLMETGDCRYLTDLKVVLVGGGPIPTSLMLEALHRGAPVCATYGLSEMASAVTSTAPGAGQSALESAGTVLPYRDLRVDDGGEILVRGDTLFLGFGDVAAPQRSLDENGWYRTGDAGWVDGEGRLHVLGRLDDMFVSGGENIHPSTIESALLAIDGLLEATVVDVPDEEFGSRPFAFVETLSGEVDAARIGKRLREMVPGYMLPVDLLPYPESAPGLKRDRVQLREIARTVRADR